MMYFGKKKSLAIPLRHWIKIEVQQKKNMDFYLRDDLIIVIVMTQQGIR